MLLSAIEKSKVNKEQNVFINNYLRMKMFKICKCYQELSSLLYK